MCRGTRMIQQVSLERLRLGWRATMLDVLTALGCYVAAYRLRFDAADARHFVSIALLAFPLIAVVHVSSLAVTGLYTVRGQVVWPLRLVVGTAIGVPLGLIAAVWLVGAEGISRLAIAGYGFMFGVAALAWRAAAGVGMRWASLRRAPPTHSDLEMQGAAYRSMTGGLLLAFQYRDLLRNLVIKDLKLKYRGSVLGFVWSLLNPLVMIVVYTVAFTYILRVPTDRYSFFVLIGVLTWSFFASAIMGSTDAITTGGGLLRSVLFPRIILPVSGVLFCLVQYLLTVAVFLPLMLAYHRIPLGPQMLLFPVLLFLQLLVISGLALALSAADRVLSRSEAPRGGRPQRRVLGHAHPVRVDAGPGAISSDAAAQPDGAVHPGLSGPVLLPPVARCVGLACGDRLRSCCLHVRHQRLRRL